MLSFLRASFLFPSITFRSSKPTYPELYSNIWKGAVKIHGYTYSRCPPEVEAFRSLPVGEWAIEHLAVHAAEEVIGPDVGLGGVGKSGVQRGVPVRQTDGRVHLL